MAFTVSYAEMHGYPRSEWNAGEFEAERRVLVAWDDRFNFLVELNAYPNFLYPYSEGPAEATAQRAKIFPFGKSTAGAGSSLADYEYALIQIFHTTRGPSYNPNYGFIIERLSRAGAAIAVDPTNLRWASDSEQVLPNDAPVFDRIDLEYHVSFRQQISLPSWILSRPGLCNSNAFPTAGLGIVFAAQTLKYMGADVTAKYAMSRLPRYDIDATFKYKPSGWNTYWRPDLNGGEWDTIKTAGGDNYIQHTPVFMDLI